MKASRVYETCLYAADLAAAKDFYTRVLGLELVSELGDRGLAFRCGDGVLLIFDARVTQIPEPTIPAHGYVGAGHLAFAAGADELNAWRAQLRWYGVPIEAEIDWPTTGTSIYFRDPAGNSIELAPPNLWDID